MPQVPGTAVVIGGGAIGCEFASMMSDLGSQVTVLEALPKILPGCDKDVTSVVERSFKKRGIEIRTGREGHRPRAGRRRHRRQRRGRRPHQDRRGRRLGRAAGPPPPTSASTARRSRSTSGASSRSTSVCRTGEDGVWAVGDCIATPAARPRRLRRGHRRHQGHPRRGRRCPIDYGKVPWGIYCRPEVAFAGHTRAVGQGGRLRRRDLEAPLQRQQPGQDHRRPGGPGEGDRREEPRRHAPARSSASTWSARGSPSSSARATWPSTGRPPSTRSPHFIQPHPTLTELFGETVQDLTGRRLH